MDYGNFRAGENGYGPTSFGIDAQISNMAGRDFAGACRPVFGATTNPVLPVAPNFGSGPYYGGPARPFPTGIIGWILVPVLGYLFARPQTEVVALAGLLGIPVIALLARAFRVGPRPTLWRSFKAACLGMIAYEVVARFGTAFVPQQLLLMGVGIAVYAAVMTIVLRVTLKGVTGFFKACVMGAVNVFLVVVVMGVVVAFTHP